MHRFGRISPLLLALVAITGFAPPGWSEQGVPAADTAITYLTTESIYIGAGRSDGLNEGDIIEVLRDGRIIATIEVVNLSSRRASCRRLTGEEALAVGDRVRFVPREREPEPLEIPVPVLKSETPKKKKPRSRRSPLRAWGLRGRIGLRYLAVKDRTGFGSDFSQPALDLKLDGRDLGGSGFGLTADVRTRRTYRQNSDGTSRNESRNRVYRMAALWGPEGSPLHVSFGRQYASSLANVSIFDGALARWDRERWSVGAFSGSQPDPEDFGYSRGITEHGAFYERRNAQGSPGRWSLTTGVVGSYEQGEINREFLYVQGRFVSGPYSGYLIQEVDYNRDWRKQAEGSTLTSSSTYLSLRARLGEDVTLLGGFDNRRQIRIYRDIETPETDFDDSYRQGVWLGASWRIRERYRAGLRARINRGGISGQAESYTLTLGAYRISSLQLDFRTRSTNYSNLSNEGWLHSLSAGAYLLPRLHLELNGGVRRETSLLAAGEDRAVHWYGTDVDVNLGRRWYGLFSWQRTEGGDESNDQIYVSLIYRL